MKPRNQTIDILRVIGLFLVISAHTDITGSYFNLREFDVVLLVFVSGISALWSNPVEYKQYVQKRFHRLIVPVWLFLLLFLPFMFLCGDRFGIGYVLKSFGLMAGGVNFIWIFRVLFTTALCTPFMIQVLEKHNGWMLVGYSVLAQVINDVLYNVLFLSLASETLSKVFIYLVTYTFSYCFIAFQGMLFIRMNERQKGFYSLFFVVLTGTLLYVYRFAPLIEYKHPPQFYYISYGIAWTCVLYLLLKRVRFEGTFKDAVNWLSINSMSIYLWHVLFHYVLNKISVYKNMHFFIQFCYLISCSILMQFIVERIKNWIFRKQVADRG